MADRTIVLAQNKRHSLRGLTQVGPQEFSAYHDDDDDLTYVVDMASYLDGDTILTVTRLPSGISVSAPTNTATRFSQRLNGFGHVDFRVQTAGGDIEEFRIYIQPRAGSSVFSGTTAGGGTQFLDGNKGDITVTGGDTWTINANAVTNAKLATMAANTIKGVSTSGTPTDLSASSARTVLGLGTMATQDASNVTITGGSITGITGFLSDSASSTQNAYFGDIHLRDDTSPSHYLAITAGENLTASRTLTLKTNDASRTLDMTTVAPSFDTVAAVTAATIDTQVNHIRTAGYYQEGDGGGALYKRSTGTPPGYITSNSGATVWEIVGTDVNVNQFGAYSNQTNASTTTAAIQAAINHVLAKTSGSGGTVRFLPGNYLINDAITIASSGTYPTINSLSIVGAGAQATQIIQGSGTEAKHCFDFNGSYASDSIQYCSVTDLKITATVTKTAGAGVRILDGFHCAVENCRMAALFIGIDNRHSAWTKIRYNRMTDLVNSTGVGLLWEGGVGIFCEYNVVDNSTTTPYAGFLYRDVGTARSGYHTQGGVTRGNQVLRCQYGLLIEGKAAITSESITFSASGGHILGTHTTDLRDYTEVVFATTGSMPTGLTAGVTYYTKRQSATTSKFATSLANAVAGTFINHTNNGSSVTLAVGAKQEWQFFDQNAWDTCTVNTCKIETTGNGEIRGLFFVGEWFGTATEHGVNAVATGGNVRNLQFTGPVVKNNGQHGMIFVNCADVLISNPLVTGNSAASSGTYNGIVFSGNSTRINVVGGLSRQSGQYSNTQAYGIVIGASITEYRIVDTDCSLNVTGTILADPAASRGSIPMHGNINQLGTQTWNGNATINGTLAVTGSSVSPVTITSTDAGASSGPVIVLDRASASPAASDVVGAFQFYGRNSSAASIPYGLIDTVIVDATAGSEDARFRLIGKVAGVDITLASFQSNQTEITYGAGGTDQWTLALKPFGAAQGEKSDICFFGTFTGTGDNGIRRAADITGGFDGGAWGLEVLQFRVGTGASNDAKALPTERMRIDGSGNVLVTSTGGLGYGTGSGGAVTQATSRTTGVTLNKTNGAITLVSAAGSTTDSTFTVTNSTVAATDTVIVSQKSGTDKYIINVSAVAAGSFNITFRTFSGTTTEQPVFNFAVIKAVAA